MKLVIGLSGRNGSGKGTVAKYLKENYGAVDRRFSNILSDILKRLHKPPERVYLQQMGAVLREQFGADILVQVMEKDLESAKSPVILIDGVRYPNETEMLRKFENSILFFIEATPKIRYERMKARGEKAGEEHMRFEDFMEAEEHETEKYLEDVKKLTDYQIDNSGSFEELYNQVTAALAEHGLTK